LPWLNPGRNDYRIAYTTYTHEHVYHPDGVDHVVEFVGGTPHLLTSSLCVYEVLEGEVLSSGRTDVVGARQTFGRIEAIEFNETIALEAARTQDRLASTGDPMPVRA